MIYRYYSTSKFHNFSSKLDPTKCAHLRYTGCLDRIRTNSFQILYRGASIVKPHGPTSQLVPRLVSTVHSRLGYTLLPRIELFTSNARLECARRSLPVASRACGNPSHNLVSFPSVSTDTVALLFRRFSFPISLLLSARHPSRSSRG